MICTKRNFGFIFVLALVACGGSVEPTEGDAGPGHVPDEYSTVIRVTDSAPDVAPDGNACWRCADRAWRNVCVVPAERGTDAESCLHCGEHCVSDPPDASGE